MKKAIIGCIIAALCFSGCAGASKTKKGAGWGAVVGTAAGAGIGAAVGGKKGALIGAGSGLIVGGLAGAAIGRYMDNQERDLREATDRVEGASIKRDQDVLELTFKSDTMFDSGSAALNPGAFTELDRITAVLNKYPQCRIRVEGHTDSTGDEESNMQLSLRRAEAVKNALVQKNVDPARIDVMGLGETMPVASNDSEGGRQMNRRVTMRIIPIRSEEQPG